MDQIKHRHPIHHHFDPLPLAGKNWVRASVRVIHPSPVVLLTSALGSNNLIAPQTHSGTTREGVQKPEALISFERLQTHVDGRNEVGLTFPVAGNVPLDSCGLP